MRLAAALLLTLLLAAPTLAKRPGKQHCYRKVCVNVLSISAVQRLVGKTERLRTSFYGDPSVDRFNRGVFTSNGERFNADDPTRTASANLPDGTELLLRNPETGAVSHVRVNDFGPFHVKRELDVTERVAKDLGFAEQGLQSLEVTVVAAPRPDDVRNLYRHDRAPVPAMGYLGIRTRKETAKLAKILMERNGAAGRPASGDAAAMSPGPPPSLRAVYSEPVYYFIPRQEPSPRSVGAERHDAQLAHAGALAVAQWRTERARTIKASFTAFSIVAFFICLVFLGPSLSRLFIRAVRRVHYAFTHDEAIVWLQAVLEEERQRAVIALAQQQQPEALQPAEPRLLIVEPREPAKPKPLVIRKAVADLPKQPSRPDWTVAPAV